MHAPSSAPMKQDHGLKQQYQEQRESVIRLHGRGAGGLRVALALTKTVDTLLKSTFRQLSSPSKDLLAIVALGGYGRKELCFGSDVDVMVLLQHKEEQAPAKSALQEFLHRLLDAGLAIGHSVRTIDECLALRKTDLESWISLLESRFLCGNRTTYSNYIEAIQAAIRDSDRTPFVRALIAMFEARHEKYGNSTKLLEPNIKNSAGGLRDLHAVSWLMHGTGKLRLSTQTNRRPELAALLESSPLKALFQNRTLSETRRAVDFLLRVRNEMHLESNSLRDTLEFPFQPQVAEGLRYRSASQRTSVENFMHDYYVAARAIGWLARRVVAWARSSFLPAKFRARPAMLDKRFLLHADAVSLRYPQKQVSNLDVLQAFLHCIEHQATMSVELEDSIHRHLPSLKPLRSTAECELFRKLLAKPRGVGEALRSMNDLGLLERWIPEWKPLVGFFQHNVYHYYTVDEHTLNVVAHAEALGTASSSFAEVFRSLPDRAVLYMACLLHDIAKPTHIGNHEVIGVNIGRKILGRLHMDDYADDVLFLIRNHLLMEQVAFRRNLNDPETIIDFASKFRNLSQLDVLFVLTYADLSAVNKNVWTEWKGQLLFELYRKSRDVILNKLTVREVKVAEKERRHAAIRDLVTALSGSIPVHETQEHLLSIESRDYLSAFDAAEIAEHIRMLKLGEPVSTLFNHRGHLSEVTVLSKDAPFALSRFCGVLSANDANILDANIFTRDDGIIIDKFKVGDFVSKSRLSETQCGKIRQDLRDVFVDNLPIESLLTRHRMKWKRRLGRHNPNVRIDVEFEEHPRFTIVDVFAPDMLGFLYKVTETISKLGLNISFAKIATRVDGIVDSFYVSDMAGNKINDDGKKQLVKSEIMKAIYELTESELVMG